MELNRHVRGHVIVYVDDIMALASDDVRTSLFDRLKQEWKCSDVETVDKHEWIRFCGFELKRHDDGVSLMVGQKSYTAELLKRHDGVTRKHVPCPNWMVRKQMKRMSPLLTYELRKLSRESYFGFQ